MVEAVGLRVTPPAEPDDPVVLSIDTKRVDVDVVEGGFDEAEEFGGFEKRLLKEFGAQLLQLR